MAQKNKPRSGQPMNGKRPAHTQKSAPKSSAKKNTQKKPPQGKQPQKQAYKPTPKPQFARPNFSVNGMGPQVPNPMYPPQNMQYGQNPQQFAGQQQYNAQQAYAQQQAYVNRQYANQQYANRQYTQQQPYVNQPYAAQHTNAQQPHAGQPQNTQNRKPKQPPKSQPKPQQKPKPKTKPKPTPEQIAEQKRLREEAKKQLKKELKQMFDIAVARVTLFLVLSAAIFVFCTGCMFTSLLTGNSPDQTPYTLVITQSIAANDYKPITETIAYNRTCIGGTEYISFSRIAALYDYITTGDEDVVSFLSDVDAKQKVSFHVNSGYVEINSVPVRIAYPSYRIDDEIYVPIEFVTKFMTGLTIEHLPDSRTLKVTMENDSKLDSFVEPEFRLHTDAPNTNVPERSLDDDILLLTDPHRFDIPDAYAGLIQ